MHSNERYARAYSIIGIPLRIIAAAFTLCMALGILFGGYIGYTEPSHAPNARDLLIGSTLHSAKANTEVVDSIWDWFTGDITRNAKTTTQTTRVLLAIPQVLLYWPAWGGAGVGGLIGGPLGNMVERLISSHPTSTRQPELAPANAPANGPASKESPKPAQ